MPAGAELSFRSTPDTLEILVARRANPKPKPQRESDAADVRRILRTLRETKRWIPLDQVKAELGL